jgi:lipoate-protein ligase A
MDQNTIYAVIVTTITVLGSTSAFKFYERRIISKEKSDNFMKDECRDRITKLEALLEKSDIAKEQMRKEILELTKEVSELRVKVEFLQN